MEIKPVAPTHRYLLIFASVVLILVSLSMIAGVPARVDESVHFAQIQLYLAGQWQATAENLTVLPGMHALTAALLLLSGNEALDAARVVSLGYSCVALLAFAALRRSVAPDSFLATLQLLWLPLLFPLMFFVYTDTLSLAFVLLSVLASVQQRRISAAVLLIFAMAIRQNNIVWGLLLVYLSTYSPAFGQKTEGYIKRLGQLWPYLIPPLAFIGYWLWNGSVSLSIAQTQIHPDFSFHTGNLFTMLVLAAVLMPAHIVMGLRDFLESTKRNRRLWIFPLALLLLYLATFRADNPFNQIIPQFFLHNRLLIWAHDGLWHFLGFGMLAVAAACGLVMTRFWRPEVGRPLAIITVVFLGLSWLIEPRYFLIPFALWQAFRVSRDWKIEATTLALWSGASVYLFFGIAAQRWFL